MVKLYKALYKALYENGVSMIVARDIGIPDTMRFIFDKGALRFAYSVDMECLEKHIDSLCLEQVLLKKIDKFLNEYEIEHKLIRKESDNIHESS